MGDKQESYREAIVDAHARLVTRHKQNADEEADMHYGVTVDGSDPW